MLLTIFNYNIKMILYYGYVGYSAINKETTDEVSKMAFYYNRINPSSDI